VRRRWVVCGLDVKGLCVGEVRRVVMILLGSLEEEEEEELKLLVEEQVVVDGSGGPLFKFGAANVGTVGKTR